MSKPFSEKVVLVTGGSTGIGAATAREIAELGAKVVITGRHEETLRASAEQHPAIETFVADVAQLGDAARTIEHVRARHGRLDVLVHNAGIALAAPLEGATPQHVRSQFETNVLGLVELTRAALPLLESARGNVVTIASVVADRPFANMSAYSATKAAVLALTRSWAKELAPRGIRVNAVSPGPIETPIFSPAKMGLSEQQIAEMGAGVLAMVPSRRFGKPEEVAKVIAFVAGPGASFVTGAQYAVGGGIEAL